VDFAAITLCVASQRVFIVVVCLFRYRLSPETFGYTLVYDLDTKLCRQKAEVIQNHENMNVRDIGQGEARHKV
jgi:hypothetical protein